MIIIMRFSKMFILLVVELLLICSITMMFMVYEILGRVKVTPFKIGLGDHTFLPICLIFLNTQLIVIFFSYTIC